MSTTRESENGHDMVRPYDKMMAVFAQRTAAKCASFVIEHIRPTDRMLDVGCGVGFITLDFARLVPQGQVIGIDISESDLAIARDAADAQGVKNVEFRQVDAYKLAETFEENSFDIIHAHQVLLHVSEPVKILQQMRRLVKSRGYVASTDCAEVFTYPLLPAAEKQKAVWLELARRRGAYGLGGRKNHEWAHSAGFDWSQIEVGTGSQQWYGEAVKEWAKGAGPSMRSLALNSGMLTAEEYDEIEEDTLQWSERPESRVMELDGTILCRK
ncbi:hypothetical protein H2200_000180 [Cladophialophora chaetospira]|uniref:Methyltransferase domain-containing protein n=1 Tax=Cladophialophora chaetospira TaxID=386627 RepID=A0AA38XN18_9EURO|nr:hypothetical protein H2200_000180 [Cladophialophora chaetospira]